MGQQGEKKEMIQKTENAKENFTGFPDILRAFYALSSSMN